jgi:pimeloyl-ACP methyl ester carboxylesterase
MTDISTSPASAASSPVDDINCLIVGQKDGITLFNHSYLDVIQQLPLPGTVIFVHGVNSDGEWYSEAEEGICKGLNDRLKRRSEHLFFPTPEGGQLRPTQYTSELTADGYLNPNTQFDTFINGDDTFSPVIRFRWGYKANLEELQQFGRGIYLNEENYWGGGPFANGCTTLPDLWGEGLSEELFLWVHVQHMNPANDRNVYACPPRPYYVLAAYRLAKLVESLRKKQADVPITIVCHSQGNMVGIAAAFLGDKMAPATDGCGKSTPCVADNYVLCNPPYSLLESNFTEKWSQRGMTDPKGHTGRQTLHARTATLSEFFKIIGARKEQHQEVARIDKRMSNTWHGFTAQIDRNNYGYNGSTYGRVTLYCNPHDQVISATPVQGIGWRGMEQAEINACGGTGVFVQRVFAQDIAVGDPARTQYNYWVDQYNKPKAGSDDFWMPHSPSAKYSVQKGVEANDTGLGKVLTYAFAPLMIVVTKMLGMRINGMPPRDWAIPLDAPKLPEAFKPEAKRFNQTSPNFDQGFDLPGESRDKDRVRDANDPFAGDREIDKDHTEGGDPREKTDAAKGDADSEAGLRYEYHALMRMKAKREGLYKNEDKVTAEDQPDSASPEYTKWRNAQIKETLAENLDSHATDHSTIMTNSMHAEKALAYDVAIGCCDIQEKDLHKVRIAADWRFLDGLGNADSNKVFEEYFATGYFKGAAPYNWANRMGSEGSIPEKIVNERKESKQAAVQTPPREHH